VAPGIADRPEEITLGVGTIPRIGAINEVEVVDIDNRRPVGIERPQGVAEAQLLEQRHLIGHKCSGVGDPPLEAELGHGNGHAVALPKLNDRLKAPSEPRAIEPVRPAVPVEIEPSRVPMRAPRLLVRVLRLRLVLMNRVRDARIVYRL